MKPARKWRRVLLILLVLGPVLYAGGVFLYAHRITPGVLQRVQAFEATGLRVADLPPGWKEVLLQVEDPNFYGHNGIDLTTPGAGLTTLTQAMVKIHYFEAFQPGAVNKLNQSLMALVLDHQMEKDQQLTLLLNTAKLGALDGELVVGFPAAAAAYFGKPFAALSRTEFVTLVAMLVGPWAYHPTRNPKALADRVQRIEALLGGRCQPTGLRDIYLEACTSIRDVATP